jgi:hypothetical protein
VVREEAKEGEGLGGEEEGGKGGGRGAIRERERIK